MPSSTPDALLLVDGYNVIGTWHHLARLRDCDGLEAARQQLVDTLLEYTASQNYETQLIFDSHYQDTPGNRDVVTSYLTICYTDYRQSADAYIEKACALYRNDIRKFNQRLIVATSDRAQQLTVMGYGAEWISAQRLWVEVELAGQRVQRKQRTLQQRQSPKRFLSSSLDPVAQQRLAQMRYGIKTNSSDGSLG
ncbi:MAG: NYN domain-containing protein [Synechococcales cyanobacterium C42_A2020_086]|jgi:predicted RNA-binding protein with PIN domain|nr:NYN domain-containing protein [Synechococcales cyanobacterium M58_A2018_015]MBF2074045.1 NYN domain-containing protein [Synechococcales cyanobacterium C42_A2020_086]